jgi:hypothetical protein
LTTWYDDRKDGGKGPHEQKTALKAAAHANTPIISHLDTLGRAFLVIRKSNASDSLPFRTVHDIEGNVLEVQDAEGRLVTRYKYNMLGHQMFSESMDAGSCWHMASVSAEPLFLWDARGNRFRSECDVLRRPIGLYVQNNIEKIPEYLLSKSIYGESQQDPQSNNLRGMTFQVFDQSGILTNREWDFKGNLILSQRQLTKNISRRWIGLKSKTLSSRRMSTPKRLPMMHSIESSPLPCQTRVYCKMSSTKGTS